MMAAALVACSTAGAEPAAPSAPMPPAVNPLPAAHPADWKAMPAIAKAVRDAAASDGITVDAADAWGEPARGCYGVWLELHGGAAAAPALADQVVASLREAAAPRGPGPRAELAVEDVVSPTTPAGVLALRFRRAPYHGQIRAQLGAGRIAALACFGNQREPALCEADCTAVLGVPARPARSSGAPATPSPGGAR